jgi:hypothetical protein
MFDWILNNWVTILAVWGGICVIVDAIVGWTSTPKDDAIWEKIKSAIAYIVSLKKK